MTQSTPLSDAITALHRDLVRHDDPDHYEYDPTQSEHTDLTEVPTGEVTIEFPDGVTRRTSWSFLKRRAMLDPDATVIPDETGG